MEKRERERERKRVQCSIAVEITAKKKKATIHMVHGYNKEKRVYLVNRTFA